VTFTLLEEAALVARARELGSTLGPGAVIWLTGDLGAGKTTFARGLLQGLGAAGEVSSPSYGLVHRYETPQGSAFHVDCYRLRHPDEARDLDWETLGAGRALIIEWPERGGAWVPPPTRTVDLSHVDDPRRRQVAIG